MKLVPLTRDKAFAFIRDHHRHHRPPVGWLFGVGVQMGGELVGVACVGRPVARGNQDGFTAEVTRVCVLPGHPNACSKLYAACWRAVRAIGYTRLITYCLESESGTSVTAAGWERVRRTKGGSWDTPARPRTDKAPTEPKVLYQVTA